LLCVLCASAVNVPVTPVNRRVAEERRDAQN
jgi:hypothetical protein